MPEDGLSLQGIERTLGVRLERTKIGRFDAIHHAADKAARDLPGAWSHTIPLGAVGNPTQDPSRKTMTQ
jgi:hypothetical protein